MDNLARRAAVAIGLLLAGVVLSALAAASRELVIVFAILAVGSFGAAAVLWRGRPRRRPRSSAVSVRGGGTVDFDNVKIDGFDTGVDTDGDVRARKTTIRGPRR